MSVSVGDTANKLEVNS